MADVFYHTKPYLLMGGGAICMLWAPNGAVIAGGLALVVLGSFIFKLRRKARV